ncbi:MAG: hypothetical protein KJ666_00365 [Bacteroidetes bacterium]|nr:hypothetical protein [Bacteroidota bacterium]
MSVQPEGKRENSCHFIAMLWRGWIQEKNKRNNYSLSRLARYPPYLPAT